jgi:tRNA threonylcarbamoyladenosine biosynthesis protein TsaE
MPTRFSLRLELDCPDATTAAASALAPLLGAGDVVLLSGQVGAGKTHFARALIQARLATAGVHEDVPSPTYTLVQTYDDGICEIWHADLYRLSDPVEIHELGLADAFCDAICLIEWPDRLNGFQPVDPLSIHLSATPVPGKRIADISGPAERWAKLRSWPGAYRYAKAARDV